MFPKERTHLVGTKFRFIQKQDCMAKYPLYVRSPKETLQWHKKKKKNTHNALSKTHVRPAAK